RDQTPLERVLDIGIGWAVHQLELRNQSRHQHKSFFWLKWRGRGPYKLKGAIGQCEPHEGEVGWRGTGRRRDPSEFARGPFDRSFKWPKAQAKSLRDKLSSRRSCNECTATHAGTPSARIVRC